MTTASTFVGESIPVDQGRLVGALSEGDIFNSVTNTSEFEATMMTPVFFHCRPWLPLGISPLSLVPALHAEPFQAGLNAVDREHYATAFRA